MGEQPPAPPGPAMKSGWNSAGSFSQTWVGMQILISDLFLQERYDKVLEMMLWMTGTLPRQLVHFTFNPERDIPDMLRKVAKYQNIATVDEEAFVYRRAIMKIELLTQIRNLYSTLTRDMQDSGILLPVKEFEQIFDPVQVADQYEELVYDAPHEGFVMPEDMREYIKKFPTFDITLKLILSRVRFAAENADQDCVFMIFGAEGSGKSISALAMHDFYTCGNVNMDHVAFDIGEFARAQELALTHPVIKNRVIHYDESHFDKRSGSTKENKGVISYYSKNRQRRGLHLWCDPDLDFIDKKLRERLSAAIYINKSTNPYYRTYQLIPRRLLEKMFDEQGSLKRSVFDEHALTYKIHTGYFLRYANDDVLNAYNAKKESRTQEVVAEFAEKFGNVKTFSVGAAARMLGSDAKTMKGMIEALVKSGSLTPEQVYNEHNRIAISNQVLDLVKSRIASEQQEVAYRELQKEKEKIEGIIGKTDSKPDPAIPVVNAAVDRERRAKERQQRDDEVAEPVERHGFQ